MQRFFSHFLVLLTIITFTPKTQAVGGLMAGQYLVAAIGGVSLVGGVPMLSLANDYLAKSRKSFWKRKTKYKVAGIVAGIVGSVLWLGGGWYLDEDNNGFEFLPLDKAELTPEEIIYNQEIEELNAVKDMIAKDLTTREFKTIEDLNSHVEAKWNELGKVLSPETLLVRTQIVQNISTSLR
jgi:hypothetical protein